MMPSKPPQIVVHPLLSNINLSLKLHNPLNYYRCVSQFAPQFPNLDNLSTERLGDEYWYRHQRDDGARAKVETYR